MRDDTKRRAELADFLKTRRARLQPAQFGLPTYGRRRTPGLRRDEVAQMAGLSVSWYTWLEQGRDIIVSDQVLDSLARILQLDEKERRHLFLLTRGMIPVSENEAAARDSFPSGYQAVLDALGTSPAYLLNQRFNVVAWNTIACRVLRDFSRLTGRDRNAIWYTLTHIESRDLFVDWDTTAQQAVASFRTIYDQHAGDAWFEQLFADLMEASPDFRRWWPRHDITWSCGPHEKALNHPQVGRLSLYSTMMVTPEAPTYRMTILTPHTQETANKLAQLAQIDSYVLAT
jgi:transcriptional regulator with XRE-family HTH domain